MVAEIYLVGNKGAVKANSYELMTNSLDEARKAVSAIPEGEMRVIKVREGKR